MTCVQGWSVSITGDIKTCTLGKPKPYTDSAAEWTTRQQERGFGRNQDSQEQIVEETMGHLTQELAEHGHDVSNDEAREGA